MDELIERLEWLAGHAKANKDGKALTPETTLREAAAALRAVREAPVAIMDTREFLSLCAPTEDDFPALYALQGQRVRLVPVGEEEAAQQGRGGSE